MTTRRMVSGLAVAGMALCVAVSGGSAGAARASGGTAGSPGLGDSLFPHAGNGGYRVGHYNLDLTYRPKTDVLHGVATVQARATKALSAFNLDLYKLHVDTVTVDGHAARFSRQGSELTLRPARTLGRGQAFTVRVAYHGIPKIYIDPDGSEDGWIATADGATAVDEPLGAMTWFPVNNHPSDKATYRVSITVPNGLKGVSNGNLLSHHSHGGMATWVWDEPDQMASYLSTATVGRFRMIRCLTAGGIPSWSFVDPTMPGGVKTAGRVSRVVTYWTKEFGTYPFTSTGLIIDRGSFGYALEVQTRPVFPFNPGTSTLVHELAHQWFGDSVTPSDWSDIWLNEGFATYAQWLWEARKHPGAPHRNFERLLKVPADKPLWHPPPAVPGTGANLFGLPVYARGAMALQALRQRIGSADFHTLLRRWAGLHRQGNATTHELEALAEHISGKPLSALFQAWLYHDGKPTTW
jgi:aminopeptidase N